MAQELYFVPIRLIIQYKEWKIPGYNFFAKAQPLTVNLIVEFKKSDIIFLQKLKK